MHGAGDVVVIVAKRLGAALAVTLLVTLLTFVVLHVIPGDAAVLQLGLDAAPDKLERLREEMGADRPLPEQYLSWIGGVLQGDWGTSSLYGGGVWEVIAPTLPVTLALAVYATLIAVVISTVLGVAAALRPGSAVDVFARTLVQLAGAAPSFLVAIALMLGFSLALRWFPTGGYVQPSEDLLGWVRSLTLPALALAIGECGQLVRIIRSSMLSSLSRGYMLSARVKGLSRARAVFGYALRGALVAPLTVVGLQLAKLMGGAIIVENVFSLPGLGRLLLTSVTNRDVMLLQGIIVVITLAVIVVSLVADLLVMAVDPQVRQSALRRRA